MIKSEILNFQDISALVSRTFVRTGYRHEHSNIPFPQVDHWVVELFSAATGAVLAFADYRVVSQLDSANGLLRKRVYSETIRCSE